MIRTVTAIVVALAVAFTLAASHEFDLTPPQDTDAVPGEMVGTWSGEAQIVVNWTAQRGLRARLTIARDGQVSGAIGDAVLRNGRLERNRGPVGRMLHMKSDWIVRADLEGDVIHRESIRRERVTVPLDWMGDHFEGSINASGSKVGGKDTMWLAARGLVLARGRDRRADR
jgi:hypothetical protein